MNLSDKLEIGPDTNRDQYSYGGIAMATADIAIAVWYASDLGMLSDGSQPLGPVGVWARAIRWTPDGPEAGPLVPISAKTSPAVQAVCSGHDGEVWTVLIDQGAGPTYGQLLIGTLTVDSATLRVHPQWATSTYPTGGSYADMAVEVWPEQDRILLANNGYGQNSVYEVAMLATDGSVVATAALPNNAQVGDLCLRKDNQKLASVGRTGTDQNLIFKTFDLTPNSIGTPVDFHLFDAATSPGSIWYLQWAYMAATAAGWEFIYMPQGWSSFMHMAVHLDGTVQENGWIISGGVGQQGAYRRNNLADLAYDPSVGETRSVVVQGGSPVTLLTSEYSDEGAIHVDDRLPHSTLRTPMSPDNWYAYTADLCCVGPGRFIFFASGTLGAITDYSNDHANFTQAVWVGGPEVTPFILTPGGQEEGRATFRRNR